MAHSAAGISDSWLLFRVAGAEDGAEPAEDVGTTALGRMSLLSSLLKIHDPQELVIDPPVPQMEWYLPFLEQAV